MSNMRADIGSISSLCKLIAKNIQTKYQRLGTFYLLHYKKRTILNLAFIVVGVVVGWRGGGLLQTTVILLWLKTCLGGCSSQIWSCLGPPIWYSVSFFSRTHQFNITILDWRWRQSQNFNTFSDPTWTLACSTWHEEGVRVDEFDLPSHNSKNQSRLEIVSKPC